MEKDWSKVTETVVKRVFNSKDIAGSMKAEQHDRQEKEGIMQANIAGT